MRCRACRKQLSAYLDGELSEASRSEIETHLAGCPTCSAATARTEQALSAVDQLPGIEPSADFDAAFARKLAAARTESARARQQQAGAEQRSWRWPALAAIATAAAVVAITLSLNRMHRPDLAAPPSAASAEIDILRNLEMLQDYDVVSRLDSLEDFEVVADLDALLAAEQDGEGR